MPEMNPAKLAANRYGKSRVRLMRVTRHEDHHDLDEWTVQVLLSGDFETAHTLGDNSQNSADGHDEEHGLLVARESKADSMEDYAKELVDFLLSRNPQVEVGRSDDRVDAVEAADRRRQTLPYGIHARLGRAPDDDASRARQGGTFAITSGLDRLTIMKTAQSGFRRLHQGLADNAARDD